MDWSDKTSPGSVVSVADGRSAGGVRSQPIRLDPNSREASPIPRDVFERYKNQPRPVLLRLTKRKAEIFQLLLHLDQ